MPCTAGAMTSDWSSTSGSTAETATEDGAGLLAARLAAGFLAGSATTAGKNCPPVTRWRATRGSVGVDRPGVSSFRPQIPQFTASGRLMGAQAGQGIEFGIDHLTTDDRRDF